MKRLLLKRISNARGQASAELAIMGAVILMLLGYLFSQGLMYNNRQALEMYTFRKSLQLSQDSEKSISLTVVRDVMAPTFFAGISRQRVTASNTIDYNVWKLYVPNEDEPEHIGSRQLLQVGDAMISKNYFVEIPPTLVKVVKKGDDASKIEPQWIPSSIAELDSQTAAVQRAYEQNSTTGVYQTDKAKNYKKTLESKEKIPMVITFEDPARMNYTYYRDDWEKNITSVAITANTIPANVTLVTDETVRRIKNVETPN